MGTIAPHWHGSVSWHRDNQGGARRRFLGLLAMTSAIRWVWLAAAAAVGAAMLPGSPAAQACGNRGQLDTLYCDDNHDFVADAPIDARQWKDPATLYFTYTPVEDPTVY